MTTNSPKETGFNMKRSDAVELIRWLSREAHKRGLGMGLKNLKGKGPWGREWVG